MVAVKHSFVCLIAACALVTAGCSSSTDTSSTTTSTTAPTTPLVTENFSGTVQPGGNDPHPFTVTANNAAITLDMTSAGPPATITMGFGIGQTVSGSCQLLAGGFGNYAASASPQLSGTIPTGTYCVMVYDVGNQSAPITYTVVIQHY
jgi:hypothetical protein